MLKDSRPHSWTGYGGTFLQYKFILVSVEMVVDTHRQCWAEDTSCWSSLIWCHHLHARQPENGKTPETPAPSAVLPPGKSGKKVLA